MMDAMETGTQDVNQRIADRVRELRARARPVARRAGRKSGVSRSMISLIERGESSPTAVVLEKLAAGLGVTLASLFDAPGADEASARAARVARRADQPRVARPGARATCGATSRRPAFRKPMQIVEVDFPAGRARRLRDRRARRARPPAGLGARRRDRHHARATSAIGLREGDCLAMQLDRPTMFHNPTRKPARYAVVIASEPPSRR